MQLRDKQAWLTSQDVSVAVVTFDSGPMIEAYVRRSGLEWPLLVDRDRALYRAYGMLRGRAWHIFGPPAIWVYLKLLAKGRRLRRPGSDWCRDYRCGSRRGDICPRARSPW